MGFPHEFFLLQENTDVFEKTYFDGDPAYTNLSLSITCSKSSDLCSSFTVAQYPVSHVTNYPALCVFDPVTSALFSARPPHTYVCLPLFVLLSCLTTCLWLKLEADSLYPVSMPNLLCCSSFCLFFSLSTLSQSLSLSPPSSFLGL